MDIIDLQFIVLITALNIHVLNGAEKVGDELCTDGICYTLYGNPGRYLDWRESESICNTEGGTLVRITSQHIQDTVMEVMRPLLGASGTVHVWTSGSKSEDQRWFDVTSSLVSQDYFQVSGGIQCEGSKCKCAFIKDTSDMPLDVATCHFDMDGALCQRPAASCNATEVSYGGLCYHVYSVRQDWNKGRQYCRSVPGRDLAYTNVEQTGLYTELQNNGYNMIDTWVGYTSRRYVWHSDTSPDEPLTYSKFRGGIARDGCVYLDPSDEGKWDIEDCSYPKSNFICEKRGQQEPDQESSTQPTTYITTPTLATTPVPTAVPVPTAAPPPVPTAAPTVAPTQTSDSAPTQKQPADTSGEPTIGDEPILKTGHIIGIAIGGILILVVIIAVSVTLTLVVTRRKQNKNKTKEENAPAQINRGGPVSETVLDNKPTYENSPGPVIACMTGDGAGSNGYEDIGNYEEVSTPPLSDYVNQRPHREHVQVTGEYADIGADSQPVHATGEYADIGADREPVHATGEYAYIDADSQPVHKEPVQRKSEYVNVGSDGKQTPGAGVYSVLGADRSVPVPGVYTELESRY